MGRTTAEKHTRGWTPLAWWALAAVLLPALALGGCVRSEAREPEAITIRCSFWGDVEDIKVWEALARKFNERQSTRSAGTRVHVKLEHIAGQDYHSKLMAMTVGECAPDVMASDDEPFPHLAQNGLFTDLNPYLAREPGLSAGDFYPPFIKTFEYKGHQYALPYIGHCLLIFYNRDLRRAAGLSPDPDPNWTWKEFDHDAVALTRDLDGDGHVDQFGLNRLGWFYSLQWIWAAGGSDMNPQMTHYLFDTPAGRRGLQFHYDHMHKYEVCPLVSDLPNMTWDSMFLTGKVAMFFTGSWWLAHCREAQNIDWDIAPMPIGPVQRSTRTTTEGLAISATTPHKEEAWEWVRFVMSDEAQAMFSLQGRGIPSVRRVALKTFARPETPQHEERFLEAMDHYARRSSIHEHWDETAQVFDREWERVEMGKETVDQFVKIVVPEADAIIRGATD